MYDSPTRTRAPFAFVGRFTAALPPPDRRRGGLLVLSSLTMALALVIIVIVTIALGTHQMAPYLASSAVVLLLVPAIVRRWPQALAVATHLACGAAVAAMFAVAPVLGGVTSVAMSALLVIPLLVAFVLDLRAAVWWAAVCALVVAGVVALHLGGLELTHIIPAARRPVSHGLCLGALLVIVLLFCRDYVHHRDAAARRLARAQELAAMVARLGPLEESVGAATQAFSGADGGLAGAMGQRAVAGRLQSDAAHASVDRLLAHAADVNAVVTGLHVRSDAITALLETLRRVAKRLEVLSFNARLEATKSAAQAFGLVAADIGDVASASSVELERLEQVVGGFASALGDLERSSRDSEALIAEVRERMDAHRSAFAALDELAGDVAAAARRLENETSGHLAAVHQLADRAGAFELGEERG